MDYDLSVGVFATLGEDFLRIGTLATNYLFQAYEARLKMDDRGERPSFENGLIFIPRGDEHRSAVEMLLSQGLLAPGHPKKDPPEGSAGAYLITKKGIQTAQARSERMTAIRQELANYWHGEFMRDLRRKEQEDELARQEARQAKAKRLSQAGQS